MTVPKFNDTIAAIATAPGEAAIGIVRLSGPQAIEIVSTIFVSASGKDLRSRQHRVFYGEIRRDGETVDEVLVHVMRAPHSYTREDVVEINCHGGIVPLQTVLEMTLAQGARLARPGEFTLRAFLNGRIDLVQAESVIDRIRAQTHAALRTANAAAHGVLSRAIYELREALATVLARVEAAIDFPEEDLPELVDEPLRQELVGCQERMRTLLATAHAGQILREGARVPIMGRPNVGKSSLFNALLRDARAIVTPHPGTTRDALEETVDLCGVAVRLIDTAGVRDTNDEIEQLGVERARQALSTADAVLFVLDATEPDTREDRELARELRGTGVPVLCVANKQDLAINMPVPDWTRDFQGVIRVSAKTAENLSALERELAKLLVGEPETSEHRAVLTHAHQRDSLRRAEMAVTHALEHFDASPEFLSLDIRESLAALGEITGETASEEILDRIFSSFCIGK